jgi:hypothetical protein
MPACSRCRASGAARLPPAGHGRLGCEYANRRCSTATGVAVRPTTTNANPVTWNHAQRGLFVASISTCRRAPCFWTSVAARGGTGSGIPATSSRGSPSRYRCPSCSAASSPSSWACSARPPPDRQDARQGSGATSCTSRAESRVLAAPVLPWRGISRRVVVPGRGGPSGGGATNGLGSG